MKCTKLIESDEPHQMIPGKDSEREAKDEWTRRKMERDITCATLDGRNARVFGYPLLGYLNYPTQHEREAFKKAWKEEDLIIRRGY